MSKHGKRWSDEEILEAIQAWAEKHGRPPSWRDWVHAGEDHPAAMTVNTRCGSWSQALEMCGFETNPSHVRRPLAPKEQALALRAKGLTRKEIAEEMGISDKSVYRMIGPFPSKPKKPQNAAERREARIQALKKALEKQPPGEEEMSWNGSTIPTPGSKAAGEQGCTCAVIDNHYGRGMTSGYGTPDNPAFWISGDCPMHSDKAREKAVEKA